MNGWLNGHSCGVLFPHLTWLPHSHSCALVAVFFPQILFTVCSDDRVDRRTYDLPVVVVVVVVVVEDHLLLLYQGFQLICQVVGTGCKDCIVVYTIKGS